MRVIAGTARSLQLKTVPGMDTRPTTDRIKETLFNILAPDIPGCIFLDLFSGSGGIGIEALSRGAEYAVLVDNSGLNDKAQVLACDAVGAIRMLADRKKQIDIIFMDPPYNHALEREVLYALAATELVGEDTLIVVESSLETEFDYLEELPFTIQRVKEYKTNKHTFIMR